MEVERPLNSLQVTNDCSNTDLKRWGGFQVKQRLHCWNVFSGEHFFGVGDQQARLSHRAIAHYRNL